MVYTHNKTQQSINTYTNSCIYLNSYVVLFSLILLCECNCCWIRVLIWSILKLHPFLLLIFFVNESCRRRFISMCCIWGGCVICHAPSTITWLFDTASNTYIILMTETFIRIIGIHINIIKIQGCFQAVFIAIIIRNIWVLYTACNKSMLLVGFWLSFCISHYE